MQKETKAIVKNDFIITDGRRRFSLKSSNFEPDDLAVLSELDRSHALKRHFRPMIRPSPFAGLLDDTRWFIIQNQLMIFIITGYYCSLSTPPLNENIIIHKRCPSFRRCHASTGGNINKIYLWVIGFKLLNMELLLNGKTM